MSTAEEQELMARISSVAGLINRHKAQQNGSVAVLNHQHENYVPHSDRGSYRTAPYSRGGYRGGRARVPTYRNKTLVLNGQSQQSAPDCSPATPKKSNGSWVTRNDRHLQLINSTVFEKESSNRTQAIEQSRRQKQVQKDQAERSHVLKFLRQNGNSASVAQGASNTPSAASNAKYEVTVDGVRFQVIKQGSKLVRAPENPPSASPRTAIIGGVLFHRTKNGNLVRHGIVKAHRMANGIKKVNVPCKTFSWTGIVFFSKLRDRQPCETCRLWCGSCLNGPQCRYIHDPSKVAICRDWLLKGDCKNGGTCDLVHETTPERTPLCLHFAKGNCNNDSCQYIHAVHSQTDPVCRAFGTCGYCEKGAGCPDRHVFECPDFSNTGVCKTKGCKLLHRERASILRKAGSFKQEEPDDLSSDDDMEDKGSDDIDSDEFDEFIGSDDAGDLDFSKQKDFIGF